MWLFWGTSVSCDEETFIPYTRWVGWAVLCSLRVPHFTARLHIMAWNTFGLKDGICNTIFLLPIFRGEATFRASVVFSSFADEEEALNSIMKDLAALGKCGGLLDNNRNKNSVHSSKQVRPCLNPPQAEVGMVLTRPGARSLNVRDEVNKCCRSSAHQK